MSKIDKDLLKDIFYVEKKSRRKRVWYYQWPDEEPQILEKDGMWWEYNPAIGNENFGTTGCDTLQGATQDLLHAGAKVWSKLE